MITCFAKDVFDFSFLFHCPHFSMSAEDQHCSGFPRSLCLQSVHSDWAFDAVTESGSWVGCKTVAAQRGGTLRVLNQVERVKVQVGARPGP